MKDGRRFGRPPKPVTPPDTPTGRVNISDPDSKLVHGMRGWVQGYNAQAACNEHQLIVAAEVMTASPDFGHLEPMVSAARRELAAAGVTDRPEVVVADAGYWHLEQINEITGDGIPVLVSPDSSRRKASRPGWNGGAYDFMRSVLATERGNPLYKLRGHSSSPSSATPSTTAASIGSPDAADPRRGPSGASSPPPTTSSSSTSTSPPRPPDLGEAGGPPRVPAAGPHRQPFARQPHAKAVALCHPRPAIRGAPLARKPSLPEARSCSIAPPKQVCRVALPLRSNEPDHRVPSTAVLVDFDNVVVGDVPDAPQLTSLLDALMREALRRWPETEWISVLLYGGWLREGVLTNRGSEIEAVGGQIRYFPMRHPVRSGLLRGDVGLATRVAAVPDVQWAHTLRDREGMQRVRFRDGTYPLDCATRSKDCPLRLIRNFSKTRTQTCHAAGCAVTNASAFRAPQQKMVDVMLACDIIEFSMRGWRVLVASSDLDVLPAVAMAAKSGRGEVAVLQVERYAADLYGEELERLGVGVGTWLGS